MTTTGAIFCREFPPEALPEYARAVERLGYDQLWVVEDCFWTGAVSAAGVAAAATERLTIGIGIMPAAFRNAALAAMELAMLARLFPGRVLAGFGHGVPAWVRQVGAHHPSPLAVLGETITAVRTLLHGGTVSVDGRAVALDDVTLEFPPGTPPPVYAGVRNEKSLRLSGTVADGTLLAEGSSPEYVRWVRSLTGGPPHTVVVYADLDVSAGRESARRAIAERLFEARTFGPANEDAGPLLASASDVESLAAALPDAIVDRFAVAGPPARCAASVAALVGAGADGVVFGPPRTSVAVALDHLERVLAA